MKIAKCIALALFWAIASVPGIAWAGACSDIVLGSALSLTGRYSTGGVHTRNGYEFAISQLNAAGGLQINGKCYNLRVIYYDDESQPDRAAALATRLIEKDRVRYLLGSHNATIAARIAAVAERNKVPMLSAHGTGNSLNWSDPHYHFRLLTASNDYFGPVLDLAAKIASATGRQPSQLKVALLFETDPFMNDLRASARAYALKNDMAITIDATLKDKWSENGATFAEIKTKAPDILLLSAYSRLGIEAVRSIAEMDIQVPMIAMTHCEAAGIATRFPKAAENILCIARREENSEAGRGVFGSAEAFKTKFLELHEAYKDKSVPDQVSEAAAAVLVFARAVQRAESLDRSKVRDAIAATDMDTFLGHIKFSADGRNVAQRMLIRQIQDGGYKVVAPQDRATGSLQWPRAGL